MQLEIKVSEGEIIWDGLTKDGLTKKQLKN